jgi:cellulose synthase/poly-beta-1,6-N-acetylglucosamine synthase-like glycosyltransferase
MINILIYISLIMLLGYSALLVYYRKSWGSMPDFKVEANSKLGTKISIIIPARNEEENIGCCLQSIIEQSYPAHLFEVLVVDDHSTDNTAAIIKSYASQNVKLISLKDYLSANEINSYKKKAIEISIQQSNGELIVTSDADCIFPKNWLTSIASFYESKRPAFIVMPVLISYGKKMIEVFQSLDFMTLQGITGASVHKKFHSMCNGANLAYTKEAFIAVNGFKGIDNIASGDDMLLMHKIYNQFPNNIEYLKSREVIVTTNPVSTIQQFFNQRIRWASKADQFDDKRIFIVLIIVYFLNVLMMVLPIVALISNRSISIMNIQLSMFNFYASLLLIKTIFELFFLYPVAKFFNQTKLLWWFPIAQPFHIVYTVIAGWLGKFGKYTWKERSVK